MIKNVVVEVEARTDTGKNESRRLRRTGMVPGVLYGMKRPPFPVAVNARSLEDVLRLESGRNTIFRLSLAGKDQTRAAMIRELQRDPVTERMLHVDFVRVDLDKKVRVNVPIRILGTPVGVKNEGGLLEPVTREVEVECLPEDIPEHLDVDVSNLHVNQHSSVADLVRGDKVKVLAEPETIVVVVAAPRVEAEVTAAAAEAAAPAAPGEPEVIKKGKESSGEGEGEAKAEAKAKK